MFLEGFDTLVIRDRASFARSEADFAILFTTAATFEPSAGSAFDDADFLLVGGEAGRLRTVSPSFSDSPVVSSFCFLRFGGFVCGGFDEGFEEASDNIDDDLTTPATFFILAFAFACRRFSFLRSA